MTLPEQGDYIDIHTHGDKSSSGKFVINNLMAHEENTPEDNPQQACSFGIHPWYLNEGNFSHLITRVSTMTCHSNMIAIGETGFDKLRGPSMELQHNAFEAHITISETSRKPVIIHCVKAWDELLEVHKTSRPEMPWLIHGFRGSKELGAQLVSKGMYLSFWFGFIIRPESALLLKSLPSDRIFFETDGSDIDIKEIYRKAATDMDLTIDQLKEVIINNFKHFFNLNSNSTTG
jgi:TatD DNase family protein